MIGTHSVLAIIPARGGSKGIPHKNIALYRRKASDRPYHRGSKNCPCIDKVLVSTDDKEIAQVSRAYGADVSHFCARTI